MRYVIFICILLVPLFVWALDNQTNNVCIDSNSFIGSLLTLSHYIEKIPFVGYYLSVALNFCIKGVFFIATICTIVSTIIRIAIKIVCFIGKFFPLFLKLETVMNKIYPYFAYLSMYNVQKKQDEQNKPI